MKNAVSMGIQKLFSTVFIILTAICNVDAQTPKLLTLQQCIDTAIANNILVQGGIIQVRQDEINWQQSRLDMLPDLNGMVNHGINQGRSIDPFSNSFINKQVNYAGYGLSSGVLLFNGFSQANTIRQNEFLYKAATMELQQAKDNLAINVILCYLQVLTNQDLLQQAREQSGLSESQVNRLEVLNKAGAIAPSLLSDLKGQYAGEQLNIINAKQLLESSKISLFEWLNIPFDKNVRLEPITPENMLTGYPASPEQIYEKALRQFPMIKAADFRMEAAQKGVKVARGRLFPTLSLNGNVNTNYSSAASMENFVNTSEIPSSDYILINNTKYPLVRTVNNFRSENISYSKQLNNNLFNNVSLNLRIPIFNSFQAKNRIKLASLELDNSRLQAKTTKTQLQQSVELAYANYMAAADRYNVLLDQVNAFAESFRAAEVRFNAGVGNSIDYLVAKNNLDRSNSSLVSAKYDLVLRKKILEYYEGGQVFVQ